MTLPNDDAPERIYAAPMVYQNGPQWDVGHFSASIDDAMAGQVEGDVLASYVRGDLLDAMRTDNDALHRSTAKAIADADKFRLQRDALRKRVEAADAMAEALDAAHVALIEVGETCWDKSDRDALRYACDQACLISADAESKASEALSNYRATGDA
jgi:hypothetical protein